MNSDWCYCARVCSTWLAVECRNLAEKLAGAGMAEAECTIVQRRDRQPQTSSLDQIEVGTWIPPHEEGFAFGQMHLFEDRGTSVEVINCEPAEQVSLRQQ
jgi:hypothetical protein